jgi:hypothetical protein
MAGSLVIYPDGDLARLNLQPATGLAAVLAAHLGCGPARVVPLTTRLDMWTGGDRSAAWPVNLIATALACQHGRTERPVRGPVLLCGVDGDRRSIDFDTAQLQALLAHLEDLAGVAELAKRS